MGRSRRVAFAILLPLMVFGAAELALRATHIRLRIGSAERRTLAAYQGVPWAPQYFADLLDCAKQTGRRHEPRYARFVLQDINEDCTTPTIVYANHVRRTWNPEPGNGGSSITLDVGMFGGSTMEGVGVIDFETIPSHFSRVANDGHAGPLVEVTNYGVSSYTFTQSLFKLLSLLRDGHHFDTVIFYGGANDIDYAYEHGAAGALFGEDVAETRIEGGAIARLSLFAHEQLNACVLCLGTLIALRQTPGVRDWLAPRLVRFRDALLFKAGHDDTVDETRLAHEIATYYGQSHALLDQIANAYHLTYLDVWQPSLMYEDRYAPGEAALARMDPRLTDLKLRRLYAETRQDVRKLGLSHFVDLSDALNTRRQAVYLDAVHLNGAGNAEMAGLIHQAWIAR